MALEKEVQERIGLFTGQKSAVPHGTLSSTDASLIRNFFCRKGRLQKIWGASVYAEPVFATGTGGIVWIDRFISRWIYQRGELIALEDSEGSKTFSSVGSINVAQSNDPYWDGRIASDKWRNRIFMVNGTECRFYEDSPLSGSKFLTLGLIPPGNGARGIFTSQPTLTITDVSAGNVATTQPTYVVTWYDAARGIESLPNGATVGEIGLWSGDNRVQFSPASAGNRKYNVDITALKAAGYDTDRVTGWFLYRLTTADSVFKRVSNTYTSIATNSMDDNVADASLGTVLNTDNSPPPSGRYYYDSPSLAYTAVGSRFVRFFRDQLWLFGVQYPGQGDLSFVKANGIVYASDTQNPDYWLYDFEVGRNNQQSDTGMAVHMNTLLFFKERSIYALEGTNPDNYVIRPVDTRRGCVAPGSIQETPAGVISLSAEGFIISTGTGPSQVISEEIFDEIRNINFANRNKIVSAYDNQEGKYECHVPMLPSSNNTQVFIYDVVFKTWQMKTIGMAQAVRYDIDSNFSRIGLAGDQFQSRLYNVVDEEQVTYNGQAINAVWESKNFDFGQPDRAKRLVFMNIKGRAKIDFRITVDIVMDFGAETHTIENILSESTYSQWAASATDESGSDYDVDNWDGDFVDKKFEIPLTGVARNFQIIIRESETSANRGGFLLEEIILQGNLLGR